MTDTCQRTRNSSCVAQDRLQHIASKLMRFRVMVRYTLTLLLVVATLLVEGEVPCTDEMAFMCGKYTTCCIANEIPVCCQSLNAICCFESETCCLKGYECTSDGMCAAKPWGRMAWRTLRTPRIIATRLRTEYHS